MIIITGASDGLGLAIATLYKNAGKEVVNISRSKRSAADVNIGCDLMISSQVSEAIEQIIAINKPIEAFISSAAVVSYEEIDCLSVNEIEKMFKTNVTGMMQLVSGLLPKIKQDEADILNVGATIALRSGGPMLSVYSTVKWAVRGFTENLQDELKNTKCRDVNFLVGGFQSRLHEKVTKSPLEDPEKWMPAEDVAICVKQILDLPKTMEISEIVVNRKTNV